MKAMLRIYRRLWAVNWASQWQYRANSLMYLLYWLVSPVVYLAVWTTIARSQGSVSGLTPVDFVNYYLILLMVDTLTSETTLYTLAYRIQDGTLSSELLLPVHPILTNTLVNNLAFKTLTLLAMLPVWLGLCLLFQPDFRAVTPQALLLAVPAILLGFAVSFLMGAILTCIAFWTTRVYSINEMLYALIILFSGQFVPLDLLPPLIQNIAQYLPFQLMRYFPVQIILGKLSPDQIAWGFGMDVIWLAIHILLFRWIWKAGLRQFSAVGS